jgi:MFS family permease
MRRLLVLASAVVFFDVAFYAAIAPILPDYVDRFGLSEAEAGILQASYAAGTLVFALPAGLLAASFGPRRTVIGGLVVFGISGIVFGFGDQILLLDLARFVQGVAGALIWSGALAWLIAAFPPERRGAVIGTALGFAVAGALLGPVLGGLAAEIGTEAVFSGVMVVAALLALVAARIPEAGVAESQDLRVAAATMLSRPIVVGTAFVAMPSLMFGAVEVLVPLRIDDLGGGHTLIALAFIGAAAIEGGLAPISGRYSDRAGRRAPFVTGVGIAAVAMIGIAVASTLGMVVAGLLLSALGAGFCFAPAMTALSEAAEASRLHQGFAAGLANVAWALGQVTGAVVGGSLASVAGFAVPNLAVAVLLVLTAIYANRVLSGGYAAPMTVGGR